MSVTSQNNRFTDVPLRLSFEPTVRGSQRDAEVGVTVVNAVGNAANAADVYIFGRNATSNQTDTFVANLDGGTRTVLSSGPFYVFGKFACNTVSPLADVDIRGSLQLAYLSINTNTTIGATDHTHFISVDNSAATVTVTLPSAATVGAGRSYRIKCRSDAAVRNVTVQRAGADTIDGAATYVMNVGKAEVAVISNGGTNWDVY